MKWLRFHTLMLPAAALAATLRTQGITHFGTVSEDRKM
jgi:hypothetical protein